MGWETNERKIKLATGTYQVISEGSIQFFFVNQWTSPIRVGKVPRLQLMGELIKWFPKDRVECSE